MKMMSVQGQPKKDQEKEAAEAGKEGREESIRDCANCSISTRSPGTRSKELTRMNCPSRRTLTLNQP